MVADLNIVVVEDHDSLRTVTVDFLRQQGHRVVGLACAEDIDDEAGGALADIFVIDLNLPGEDGLSLARRLRKVQPGVGIIMVTARNRSQDKALGYDSGADIYLSKPAAPEELLAAINALARRLKPAIVASKNILVLNLQKLTLQGSAGDVGVTQLEAVILNALARAPDQRLDHWQIAAVLGKAPDTLSKANLDVKIFRLRKKIAQVGGDEAAIKAIRKQGYQLCASLIAR
jgi:DNA-binding response OmpR family regulator